MSDQYILDEIGEPVLTDDLCAWGTWMQTADRRVALTEIPTIDGFEPIRISTVFLGLDHNFSTVGPPVLWETMVFGGPLDGEQDRYTSKAEAEAGHAAMVKRVEAAQ